MRGWSILLRGNSWNRAAGRARVCGLLYDFFSMCLILEITYDFCLKKGCESNGQEWLYMDGRALKPSFLVCRSLLNGKHDTRNREQWNRVTKVES